MLKTLGPRVRSAGVAVALAAALVLFGAVGHWHYPIQKWLFWRYAGYWLAVIVWAAVSFGLGHLALRRVYRVTLPLLEHVILAFALGVYGFELAMFGLGLCQGYRGPAFFALPLVLLGLVALPLFRFAKRLRRGLARHARSCPRIGAGALAIAFGCLGLGMVYFNILTPDNIQFDARWKHMALAEDYVAHGGVHPAPEGWLFAARPNITSFLYAWAFLLPRGRLFDHMVLSAHLEFAIFLMTTVVGIGALVRKLVPKADPRWVWAARFLFPGVLLYDSSVSGGADHAGALYAVPIALCLFRVYRDLDLRHTALLATFLSAATLVKETAALMLVPLPVLAVALRVTINTVKAARGRLAPEQKRRLYLAPLLATGVCLAATSPLWLKNYLFYGDPLYPNLHRFFSPRPWSEAAAYKFTWGYSAGQMWAPSRDMAGLIKTFKALFTYSFIPNDWKNFHRNVPVFGSLFTLLLACLPFLRGTRRIWGLVLWVHLGIFAWYSVHHQDRYLQGILPIMTAATAAMLILVWRSFGAAVRVALCALVGLQIVWGGDVFFIQTHAMTRSPAKKVIDLLSAGYERKYEERFTVEKQYQAVGAALPKGARVLYHEQHLHLGAGAESVLDSQLWQYALEYGDAGTPEGVRQMLRQSGITHVYFAPARSVGAKSIAADILFQEFAIHHLVDQKHIGNGILGRVPETPSTKPFSDTVAALTCKVGPPRGLYRLAALRTVTYGPKALTFGAPERAASSNAEAVALLPQAEFVVFDPRCAYGKPTELSQSFKLFVRRKAYARWKAPLEIWRRNNGQMPTVPSPPPPSDDDDEEEETLRR